MTIRDEIDRWGFWPTVVLLVLSLGSANRGFQAIFNVDVVTLIFGEQYAGYIMIVVGLVGMAKLLELFTDYEVFPYEH